MKYGTVCSGIEAPSVAWHGLGFEPQFFSEIEKFPSKLLQHYFPTVPNLGDMTKFKEWSDYAIDVFCGGTPCQSFSIAGLRKGLEDPRGNLCLTYLAICERYNPRWVIWENVPGVLSSNKGRDFAAFIGALGQLGYGFAYRVLDAQYFGVAQRRRRVFVVGYLGDWRPAAAVLFEPESVRGDTPPSRKTREEIAGTLGARSCRSTGVQDAEVGHLIPAYGIAGNIIGRKPENGGNGEGISEEIGYTLTKTDLHGVAQPIYGLDEEQNGAEELMGCLKARIGGGGCEASVGGPAMQVRRITPRECERLQGFPDNYTAIPGAADGPRYKALGNSMAVPVMRWIGERILAVDTLISKSSRI